MKHFILIPIFIFLPFGILLCECKIFWLFNSKIQSIKYIYILQSNNIPISIKYFTTLSISYFFLLFSCRFLFITNSFLLTFSLSLNWFHLHFSSSSLIYFFLHLSPYNQFISIYFSFSSMFYFSPHFPPNKHFVSSPTLVLYHHYISVCIF